MLTKVVALFLVGIAVLAMFGRLRVGPPRPRGRSPDRLGRARLCPSCNRLLVGPGPCSCGGGGGRAQGQEPPEG